MRIIRENIFYILFAFLLAPLLIVFAGEKLSSGLILNISGLFGLLLFSFQVFLGIPDITRLFTLDRISLIRIHTFLGIFGSLFIFAHPISFLVLYESKISALLLLNFASIPGIALSFGKIAFALLVITWVLSSILKSRIPYKYWRISHLITYPIVVLSFVHAYMIGSYISGNNIIHLWFIVLASLNTLAILYRIFGIIYTRKTYIISDRQEISEGVNLYTLSPKNKRIVVRPGQFVYVSIGQDSIAHPFTVLGIKDNGDLELCIKRFGNFTNFLSTLPLKTEVKVSEPQGVFLENPKSSRVVCVAGGIGITPFLHFVESHDEKEVLLHYFTRNKDTAFFRDRLSSKLKDKYKEYFSDESRISVSNWVGSLPREDLDIAEFYLCGPDKLVADIKFELQKKGVPKSRISTEQFAY